MSGIAELQRLDLETATYPQIAAKALDTILKPNSRVAVTSRAIWFCQKNRPEIADSEDWQQLSCEIIRAATFLDSLCEIAIDDLLRHGEREAGG